MATEEDGEPFRIGVTLACLQHARKLPRRKDGRNTTLRRGARTQAVKKKRKHTQGLGCPHKGPSLTRATFDLNAKVLSLGDGWQVSSGSTDSLDCLRQNYLTAVRPYQPTHTPVHHPHQQTVAMANSSQTQQT